MSLADNITVSRMVAAPLLLIVAAAGFSGTFIVVAMYGFATDASDGAIARTLGSASERGARLDSRADLCFYTSVLLGLLWLFPERLAEQATVFSIVLTAYLIPISVGWLKFRRLTSYHTVLAKVSLFLLAVGLFSWLMFDTGLLLRAGSAVLVVSALEELALTLLLTYPRDNISSVVWLLNNNTLGEERCIQRPLT